MAEALIRRSGGWGALGIALSVTLVAVGVWAVGWVLMYSSSARLSPVPPIYEIAAAMGLDQAQAARGQATFGVTCAVCHGQSGRGVVGLGKPLRNSEFVQGLGDRELAQFVIDGRLPNASDNTSGVAMPPRGGNALLGDADVLDVVVYLRTMQDPSKPFPNLSAWIIPESERAVSAGPAHDLFVSYCSACHGPTAEGMPDLGKPLKTSEFVSSKSDDELLAFVKQGRPIWDPLNTTGVDMPPKGGNPALSDDEIRQIIEYLRSVHTGG